MSAYLRKEPPKGNTKDVQNWFIMVQLILEIEYILKMVDKATIIHKSNKASVSDPIFHSIRQIEIFHHFSL